MSAMSGLAALLEARVSTRAFRDTPVSQKTVEDLLNLARQAPSGGNLQPWRVHVVSGTARQAVIDAVQAVQQEHPLGEPDPEYRIYPKPLAEPWRTRRYECGETVYAAAGIAREDKMGRLVHVAGNFQFWNAPVGLFIGLHKDMEPGQWSDLGMFIQTFLLAATEAGLGTCAQEAWSIYPRTVKTAIGMPDDHTLFCGIALGHADLDAGVNQARTSRAGLDEIAVFDGF